MRSGTVSSGMCLRHFEQNGAMTESGRLHVSLLVSIFNLTLQSLGFLCSTGSAFASWFWFFYGRLARFSVVVFYSFVARFGPLACSLFLAIRDSGLLLFFNARSCTVVSCLPLARFINVGFLVALICSLSRCGLLTGLRRAVMMWFFSLNLARCVPWFASCLACVCPLVFSNPLNYTGVVFSLIMTRLS
jgi:hypothetical protein